MSATLRRFVVLPVLALALMAGAFGLSASQAEAFDFRLDPGDHPVIEAAGADLVVSSVVEGYGRAGWYTSVTVRNQGNEAAGHFYVRFNEWPISVSGLAPGAITTMRFYREECEVNSTISVDAYNEVGERNESNNRVPWLVLC